MERPWKRPHRLPVEVYARPDFVFAFTICTAGRQPILNDAAVASKVIDSILWTRKQYGWLLFAYCLMPDHLHIVFRNPRQGKTVFNAGRRGQAPLSVIDHVARFKSFTTKQFHDSGHHGPFWQQSSYDTVYDDPNRIVDVVRYVLENPIRAELVKYADDWPYSKIVDLIDIEDKPNSRDIRCRNPRNLIHHL